MDIKEANEVLSEVIGELGNLLTEDIKLSPKDKKNKAKLTPDQLKLYDGLSRDARGLFNDLATSSKKYHGQLGSHEGKLELKKNKLADVEWHISNPARDYVALTKKGKAIAKKLFGSAYARG